MKLVMEVEQKVKNGKEDWIRCRVHSELEIYFQVMTDSNSNGW